MNIHDFREIWKKPRVRLLFWGILGCYGLYLVLGFWVLPPVFRWVVQTQGEQALGRRVSIQNITFNPFTLTADIKGLRVADMDDQQDFIRIGRLFFDLSLSSVWYRGLVLKQLRIEHPYVHIQRTKAGRFNFSDIQNKYTVADKENENSSSKASLPFSLNNIELIDGEVVFDDASVGRVHRLSGVQIGIPFISNLPAHVESFVKPHLSAMLNGASIQLQGQVRPFADRQDASVDAHLDTLDIAPYLTYLPKYIPVRIERAKLRANLHIVWGRQEQGTNKAFSLSGMVGLQDTALKDYKGNNLLALKRLDVDIGYLTPMSHPFSADFRSISFDGLHLEVRRDGNGQINLADWGSNQHSSLPSSSKPSPQRTKPVQASSAPLIKVEQLRVNNGSLHWQDNNVSGGFQESLRNIEIQARKFDLQATTAAHLDATADGLHGEHLKIASNFSIKAHHYDGHIALSGVDVGKLYPYYRGYLGSGKVGGTAAAKGRFLIASSDKQSQLEFDDWEFALKEASLFDPSRKESPILLPDTLATGIKADIENHVLRIGYLKSSHAVLQLQRLRTGKFSVETLLHDRQRQIRTDARQDKGVDPKGKAAHASPWLLSLGGLELSGWKIAFKDYSGTHPVSMNVSELGMKIADWDNRPNSQANVALSGHIGKKGRFLVKGRLGIQPFKGYLQTDIQNVGILPVQPYIDKLFRVLITKGTISAHGKVDLDLTNTSKPQLKYRGSLALANFNSLDQLNNTDFMRWKSFALTGIDFKLAPLVFHTQEIRLEDFYSRLILSEKGQLNVREIMEAEDTGHTPTVTASAVPTPSSSVAPVTVGTGRSRSSDSFDIAVAKIVFVDGHISYNDRFIKPNYFANLLAVEGQIDGLSSDQTSIATLALKARMDGAAPVTVSGTFNPFRQDDLLDIKAGVQDVDLVGVSTYAAKYVGYGIKKGKLSMSVEYKIRDRNLTAKNKVVLNQLTFGEKADSPDATSLPVLFAVALLKDRHGVIDVNLPISGSLDDPQFSVGGVVIKVIVNLISKAVASPFTLIGSAFGGGEELSYVDFAPGSAKISDVADKKLLTLAKALVNRPELKLEISGRVDPVDDVAALKRIRLRRQVTELKAQQMRKQGETVDHLSQISLSPSEYAEFLAKLYETQKIDARPRDALGMLKKLPIADMEKIVLGSYVISNESLQRLADWRARTVRTRLLQQPGIGSDRIFLLSSSDAEKPRNGEVSKPMVEFLLK